MVQFFLSSFIVIGFLATQIGAQAKSEVEFYDSTGTTSTTKFGWQGSSTDGNFYIETPEDGEGFKLQKGNLTLDGNVNATSFSGDGSGLTNVGDITGVSAGSGLKGGADSGNASLNVDFAGTGEATTASHSDHNHGTAYSTTSHNHSGTYATSGHTHTGKYIQKGSITGGSPANIGDIVLCKEFDSNCTDKQASISINNDGVGIDVENYSTSGTTQAARFQIPEASAVLAYRSGSDALYAGFFNGQILTTGGCTGCATTKSDKKFKKEISKIEKPLKKIRKIRGVSYKWNEKGPKDKKQQYGVVAQEVQKVLPKAVVINTDSSLSVNYNAVLALLIESVKEQQVLIDKQSKRILDLEKKIGTKLTLLE